MSDYDDFDRDDDDRESRSRLSHRRRNSPNEDSGSNHSHRCKLILVKENQYSPIYKMQSVEQTSFETRFEGSSNYWQKSSRKKWWTLFT